MDKASWEQFDEVFKDAAKKAIAETHKAGRPSVHGDEKGIYNLYPDGRKEYIKPLT